MREAAAGLREASQEVEGTLPSAKPEKPARAPKKAPKDDPPWAQFLNEGSPRSKRLANFNLPVELDAKLTWAAHRTFGTRTDVLVKALTEYIDRLVEGES